MRRFLLNTHPFSFLLETDSRLVCSNLKRMYGDRVDAVDAKSDVINFNYFLRLKGHSNILARYLRPQAQFFCDQREPFLPMAYDKGYAMLEWGMNWVIASHEVRYTLIHSAVLAKDNQAVLFPAPPGSGKSTLTAFMSGNGWRLLSDEMGVIAPGTRTVTPFVRPVCLKNHSIDVVKRLCPDARFSDIAPNTHKGDVAHFSPPETSWKMAREPAEIVGIVFPEYIKDTFCDIYELNKIQSFKKFSENAFNYGVLGKQGFNTLTTLIEKVPSYHIQYNDVGEVQSFIESDILGL